MAFNYIPGAPEGSGSREHRDFARAKAEPLTPRSEQPRAAYGSLEMSLQMLQGRCEKERKCIKQDGHADTCWPRG